MAAQKDLNRLIHRSHISFNSARNAHSSTLDAKSPSINTPNIIRRNLSSHDLTGIFFYNCTFVGAYFGTLNDVSFNLCTFTNCDFGPTQNFGNGAVAGAKDVTFFECTFNGGSFERQNLSNFKIVDPTIEALPSFEGAIFSHKFVYDHDPVDIGLLDKIINAETAPHCDLQIIGSTQFPRMSWEQIRFVAKLPFLQVSFVGIVAVAAIAVITSSIEEPINSVSQQCTQLLIEFPEAQSILNRLCEAIPKLSFTSGTLEALRFMFLNFLVIFLGALIQTIKCPIEISEFSRAYWTRQLRRPSIFYTALAHRERYWMIIAGALQAGGVGFFLYRAGNVFVRTFS